MFYPNILEYIQELATDQFGNFYIKKLFQFLSEEKLLQLIAILFPILPAVGANQYGARVLQDLIDFLNTEKLINSFIKILIPHIDVFITDQNGSHVIYKILSLSDYQSSIVLFFEHILTKIGEIASSKKGCTFIQKCLETLNEEKLIMLIKAITANLFSIITNKYGNYIIQSVLTIDNFEYKKGIYEEILKNVCFYSNQKYSSNVMEKCFLEKKVDLLLTTTILERGVTFKHVWVIIIAADDSIYTAASLVQIAGRVGRAKDDPSGLVLYCYHRYTKNIRSSIKQIKEMNK